MITTDSLNPQELAVFKQLSQDKQSLLSQCPEVAQLFLDWSANDPMPVGTEYEDVEVYCNGDRVLQFLNNDIAFAQEAESTDEIVIWANGEVVWIKLFNTVLLDRTINAPLNVAGGMA